MYEVPGHDEGQLALGDEELHWFFAGDLFQTVGTVVIGGDEGDMKKYMDSLEKVISFSPRFIFPSHGIATGGTHRLEETLRHRRERESSIAKLLAQGQSEDEIFNHIYPDLDPKLRPYAQKTILSHIKKIKFK